MQKAETDYGGRKWTVWFTTGIPVAEGPYIFYGLPGLIVRAADARSDYDFTRKEVKKIREIYSFGKKDWK